MENISFFTPEEKAELFALYKQLIRTAGESITKDDTRKLKKYLIHAAQCNHLCRNNFGMNPVIRDLQTAVIVADEIGMKGSCLVGIMLHEIVKNNVLPLTTVRSEFGEDVASIITGLVKTNELYAKSPAIESENFRNLLLSFAEDMRVILIMIADRVNIMRQIPLLPHMQENLRHSLQRRMHRGAGDSHGLCLRRDLRGVPGPPSLHAGARGQGRPGDSRA